MEVELRDHQLTAVEYPGTVINVKNLMKQLGNEKKLSSTLNDTKKRLELKFRPDDVFSKSAFGDRFHTTGLVLEVVRKRKKNASGTDDVKFDVACLGYVKTIYKFKAMIDFQKLPVETNSEGEKRSLLPKIVPKDLHPASWLEEETPLFITPLFFSRFDYPQSGYSETLPKNPKTPKVQDARYLKSQARHSRAGYSTTVSFDSPLEGIEPRKEALELLKLYGAYAQLKVKLDALFADRPIWSRSGILANLNCDEAQLKCVLGCSAYHFANGPWRTLWVRFGYDPRKDPTSKVYQVMDFRVNPMIKLGETRDPKRKHFSYHAVPVKAQKTGTRIPHLNTEHLLTSPKEELAEEGPSCSKPVAEGPEEVPQYIFLPGRVPAVRQCYFQMCDIKMEAVQELVHQNDGREQFCHEREGWCDIGVLDKCRELITQNIREAAQKHQDAAEQSD